MNKATAVRLVRGLKSRENRKHEFFRRLKQNLAADNPKQQNRIVKEFRTLIIGP